MKKEEKLYTYFLTFKKAMVDANKKKVFTFKATTVASSRILAIKSILGFEHIEIIECRRIAIPTNKSKYNKKYEKRTNKEQN